MEYARDIINALNEEHAALSTLPSSAILTSGERVHAGPLRIYYKFDVPDNFFLLPGMTMKCVVGSGIRFSFPAIVADVHSQFVYLLFPVDMGEQIAELSCAWNPAEITARLHERWLSVRSTPLLGNIVDRSFSDNSRPFTKEPIFPSTFTEPQLHALKESLSRRISIVFGERRHGKTGVAAALLFNSIREGKRILYLTSSSDGLYHCMNEVVQLNPVVAEESIAIIDAGLDLQTPLPVPHISLEGVVDPRTTDGLKKLFTVIAAEHEYARANELQAKIAEKLTQTAEAAREADAIKEELERLQSMSMIERMKMRNHKAMTDETQTKLQHKLSLVDRLKQQASMLSKEFSRKERMLPLPLTEKKTAESFASAGVTFTGSDALRPHTTSKRCIATTLSQALLLDPALFEGIDIVCLDDAHAFNLPEFFYCASLAGERCYILADATEQPPQSVSQGESARQWLQQNFFHYIRQPHHDDQPLNPGALPKNLVSELTLPGRITTVFEALLNHVLNGTSVPASAAGRIHFINTEGLFAVSPQFIGKKKILPYNEVNAKKSAECVKHALMSGTTTQSDIMVVAPPSGQTMYLREHLHGMRMPHVEIVSLGSLRLCSKRAVILDLTVAGLDFTLRMLDERKSGLQKIADIFNTLLSTVQEDLYVVADLGYFRSRYKGKFIEKLLSAMHTKSENIAAIGNAARRFDDLSFDMRRKILFSTAAEKQSPEYRAMMERSKPSALDQSIAQQHSIAKADTKLRNDIYAATLRVLAKRMLINIIAQYLETKPLYKSTAETQKYISALPEYECENENDFKAIMDMWNVLIYETSNARQQSEHPLATKAKVDSKIATDIQQIYYYYHSDLEMVVEEGKHKLAQSVQKIFNDCIGKKPVTPADWKNAYLIFLNRMEKYLDTIVNQVRV